LKSGAAFRGVCKDFSELFADGFTDVAGSAEEAGRLGAGRLRARLRLLLRLLWQQHRQGLRHPLSSYAPLFPQTPQRPSVCTGEPRQRFHFHIFCQSKPYNSLIFNENRMKYLFLFGQLENYPYFCSVQRNEGLHQESLILF